MLSADDPRAPATVATIYHMLPAGEWADSGEYSPASLADEGFIHCTGDLALLQWVANRFYRDDPSRYLVLVISTVAVHAPIRWEEADGRLFPHIYGALNRDAVVDIRPFLRAADGTFQSVAG